MQSPVRSAAFAVQRAAPHRAGEPPATSMRAAAKASDRATSTAARRAVLSLKNIDRALRVGDVACFVVAGVVVSYRLVGAGEAALTCGLAIVLGAFVFARMLARGKVYDTAANVMTLRLARRLAAALVFTFVVITAVAFALHLGEPYARGWLGAWLVATFATVVAYRAALAAGVGAALRRGHLRRRVAIYGGDAQGAAMLAHLAAARDEHYAVVGYYDDRRKRVPAAIQGFDRRGGLAELERDVERGVVDEVMLALPLSAADRLTQIMNRLSRYAVTVLLAPDLAMWRVLDSPFETVARVPVLRALDSPVEGWAAVAKVVEDRVLAVALVALLSPLIALVAVAIRLDSPGPVFFRQPRRGWNGAIFTIYKFRTMRVDHADLDGALQTTRDDPRVTRIGRLLRRSSIDELPQLLNVLTGDMSLVGPRPHALGTRSEGKPFDEAVADYMRRYRVKPGITGWAQVNGWRGETDTTRKLLVRVRYDIEYIENWSPWFDLYILAITPLSLLVRSGNAY